MSSFQKFHEVWHEQLRELVQQLNKAPRPAINQEQHELHTQLIQKVTSHYSEYNRVKSIAAKNDVLCVFNAPWSNSLERSLYWVGGWRPTTAFHIIYTESGILFESHIFDILNSRRNGDLGDLSPNQLTRFSELQCEAIQQENAITEELSDWQDSANDIMGDIDKKMERLVGILERADQLRLRTIENLLHLLTAQQAVEFLIAAAHLLFGIHNWGVNHDRQRPKG
ncbi:protein DOG1-like 3 [Lycium ferocissimum]|uniref:protein DOG1-like 3 n=1 Tax=Lycium ferocissimum TaxID=112874 RepID=UPI0028166071|nr:protein DOG1-like 3 [Lycium ferocissimum]